MHPEDVDSSMDPGGSLPFLVSVITLQVGVSFAINGDKVLCSYGFMPDSGL